MLKSFYRALEAQHIEIALLLLSYKQTLAMVSNLKLVHSSPFSKEINFNYLEKIKKSNHYNFRFNPYAVKGNVALIIAAGLSDSTLFDELLKFPEIGCQFKKSGITCFLSATISPSGSVKEDINSDIAFNLLESSAIHEYAESRPHDYETLLDKFDHHSQIPIGSSLNSIPSVPSFISFSIFYFGSPRPSFASLASSSERTTPAADSRPTSVMETLIEANFTVTSVMETPRIVKSTPTSQSPNEIYGLSDCESDDETQKDSPTFF